MEDLDCKIILKWFYKKLEERTLTGLIWLRIETGETSFEGDNERLVP
jgi:hypothetical protein